MNADRAGNRLGRAVSAMGRSLLALAAVAAVGAAALVPAVAVAPASAMVAAAEADLDKLIMRNGRVIEGRILDESAKEVRMEVIVAGISAVRTFDVADILSIERAAVSHEPGDAAEPADEPMAGRADEPEESFGGPVVYHMRLDGVLGREIHAKPIGDILNDARRAEPDFLIVEIDNAWESWFGQERMDIDGEFDQFFQAEDVIRLFTRNMPMEWEKQPRIVFWVKNAMGGVAFMPFLGDDIYFHPDGKMGGVGNLSEMMAGVGDEVVREKQRSLRLAMAEGVAIRKGYDYRLVRAMARREYVLSYKIDGGRAVLLERNAEGPGEFDLTFDGTKDENKDSMRQIVTGQTREVLTLRPEDAVKLGVSKGTASTLDDVLNDLGILRNYEMADSRADRILEQWESSVERAKREIPRLMREYEEVGQGNQQDDARRTISRQIRILEEVKSLLERYAGAIIPQEVGVGGIAQLNLQIEQLKIQLILLNP